MKIKIDIQPFNEKWKTQFEEIKTEFQKALTLLESQIDHVGSTSIEGLSAKPIIDILVGLNNESQLDKTIKPLTDKGYVYYEMYNSNMPYRRFFIKTKNKELQNTIIKNENQIDQKVLKHSNRIAHIHIIPKNSIHWLRHIAFKHYLIENPEIRNEYQGLKEKLSLKKWKDGNEYNAAKNDFIKYHEEKALKWYEV